MAQVDHEKDQCGCRGRPANRLQAPSFLAVIFMIVAIDSIPPALRLRKKGQVSLTNTGVRWRPLACAQRGLAQKPARCHMSTPLKATTSHVRARGRSRN